jgi:two-component system chemotaxis sensor kinase CheA
MSADTPKLREEFLDDFYAECDELLGNIRAQLNQLDEASRDGRSHAPALEALYRNAHSFKGISAMVGLREAEQLAHSAEGLLRQLCRGETALTSAELELLERVTHRFEHVVTAHRLHQALPDTLDLIAQLRGYEVPADTAAGKTERPDAAPDAATAARPESSPFPPDASVPVPSRTVQQWCASFSPSAELDQRGVNINSVRTRLGAWGEIIAAAPVIQAGGRMTFEFTLASREPPADRDRWEADGILFRPLAISAASSASATGSPVEAGTAAPSSMFVAPSHIVRVDLSRLDDLMRIVGEMVIHRSRLDQRIVDVTGERSELQEVNLALGRSLRELREAITRVRLVPIAEIFSRLPFVVRDLAREMDRKVRIVVEGQDTEIDKYVVERLKEPLLHLVRNAVSHGIETPAERVRAGKPEEATLVLHAATSGQSVVIRIRDDGRGVDAKRIAERAASLGITLSESPSLSELLEVISRPGFSTREAADRAAGRGVGMAVVHRTVRDLAGSLSLDSVPGQWTQFTLRLPLTLSIADTFLVSAADQTCAVPQTFVEEVMHFAEADVRTIQAAEVISYRDGILPLIRLRQLFGVERSGATHSPLLVLGTERGLCGLVVDRVHGQREVVVRAIHDPLITVPGVSGATELGDGRPVLILDPVSLASGAVRPRSQGADMMRKASSPRAALTAGA